MTRGAQQVFDWAKPECDARAHEPASAVQEAVMSAQQQSSGLQPSDLSMFDELAAAPCEQTDGPPLAAPLPAAVAAGVFGLTTEGPVVPDADAIAEMTAEHAHEMIVLLADCEAVADAIRTGHDPRSGRTPKTPEARARLGEHLATEERRLRESYADAVAAYAEAFGDDAANALDAWVRKVVAGRSACGASYEPTHPWHYFHAGDNAAPMPVNEIPADSDAGRFIESDLPKNPAKRIARLHDLAERERQQLDADVSRYADIVERGAEALSRYDREIAYSSDALALASALALKYRHISLGRGRLQWIKSELERLGASNLFDEGKSSDHAKVSRAIPHR
ncbi:MAG: hypothetical protein FLDDKLPJ_02344 [Phycisphaerae bacterium]|nr:hypothetical protein [Phycisphaerae bacterium]